MKNIFNVSHSLVNQIVKKTVVLIAISTILPASVAIAEPSAGMLGSVALSNAASTTATANLKRPKEEQFIATFTAYTPRVEENDADPLISADGHYVYDGLIACSREYPFGTQVIIQLPSGKQLHKRCGDRMAQKNDHTINLSMKQPKFDIWMSDLAAARQWGVRSLPVTVQYN